MPYKNYEVAKERAKLNYYKNREKRLKQAKKYYYDNWDAKQEYRKNWIEKNKEKHKEWINTYYKDYRKIKNHANQKVFRALQSGELIRKKHCEMCKSKKTEHAHHDDYSKPLKVIWLCRDCHVQIHKEKRNDKLA